MREYILDIARDLHRDRPDATVDEIAAAARLDASHIHDYFRGIHDIRAALTDAPDLV
ncbi:TetR family transcriptional regulator [Nocardia alni]|uniref:TetR family transcriptional regulator n=1 Tax=Nocardia alni TaxID=2815723 RepID=UPI001C2381AD|nr:TetR family transcriptional regulator [Nocardia alni]